MNRQAFVDDVRVALERIQRPTELEISTQELHRFRNWISDYVSSAIVRDDTRTALTNVENHFCHVRSYKP